MKILWGLEPFTVDTNSIKGMSKMLRQLAPGPKDLEVGYIATENEIQLHTAFDVPQAERFNIYPQKLILKNLRNAKVSISDKNVQVIHHRTLSTTKAVDRFLKLGKSLGAQMLALHTHGKKGFNRFVLGSFAETAIHRSKIDLLVVNPKTLFGPRIKNVLLASDFTARSKKDFLRVLKTCKTLRAHLTVFHAADIIYSWSLDESNPNVRAYRSRLKRMTDWIEQSSKKLGFACTVVIQSEPLSISALALRSAKKSKVDLLVVSAKGGPLTALMGGSVTRQIVRNGTYPVWVLK